MDKKIFFTGIAIFAIVVLLSGSIYLIIRSNQPKINDDTFPEVSITSPDSSEINAFTPLNFEASVTDVAVGYQAVCTWQFNFHSEEGRELYLIETSKVENDYCRISTDGFFRTGDLYVSIMVEEVNQQTNSADSETNADRSYTVKE